MEIRLYRTGDSIEAITTLLNRAYAGLAERGFRFVASWQTPEMTLERIGVGHCYLALDGGGIVGTIALYPPAQSECELYRKHFHFGKFGVDPSRAGEGIGPSLYMHLEGEARRLGATELCCDTAKGATQLIEMYQRWGYEIVGETDWSMTNYESYVLLKRL